MKNNFLNIVFCIAIISFIMPCKAMEKPATAISSFEQNKENFKTAIKSNYLPDSIIIGHQENPDYDIDRTGKLGYEKSWYPSLPFSIRMKLINTYYEITNFKDQILSQAPSPLEIIYTPLQGPQHFVQSPFEIKQPSLIMLYTLTNQTGAKEATIDLSDKPSGNPILTNLIPVFNKLIAYYDQKNPKTISFGWSWTPDNKKQWHNDHIELTYLAHQDTNSFTVKTLKDSQNEEHSKVFFEAFVTLITQLNNTFKNYYPNNIALHIDEPDMYTQLMPHTPLSDTLTRSWQLIDAGSAEVQMPIVSVQPQPLISSEPKSPSVKPTQQNIDSEEPGAQLEEVLEQSTITTKTPEQSMQQTLLAEESSAEPEQINENPVKLIEETGSSVEANPQLNISDTGLRPTPDSSPTVSLDSSEIFTASPSARDQAIVPSTQSQQFNATQQRHEEDEQPKFVNQSKDWVPEWLRKHLTRRNAYNAARIGIVSALGLTLYYLFGDRFAQLKFNK